ncbi:hypothetical protein T11_3536 [Trichinella zimbabwensis]|uniref:Uncharacterized protein n=1 Tax=Trichinella zimbabwensis TaxID=268475 RepID=A0A0V1HFG1_9BILA|nr:hypothetical protein T11_3536 [Trichinella zimbabwensis]
MNCNILLLMEKLEDMKLKIEQLTTKKDGEDRRSHQLIWKSNNTIKRELFVNEFSFVSEKEGSIAFRPLFWYRRDKTFYCCIAIYPVLSYEIMHLVVVMISEQFDTN